MNSTHLLKFKREENVQELAVAKKWWVLVRECPPSEVFGARRKVAQRRETYVWTPVLRFFNKLREVGVSPYLSFILHLSTLLMFELNETVRGRLISSKSWNRGVGFLKPMWTLSTG